MKEGGFIRKQYIPVVHDMMLSISKNPSYCAHNVDGIFMDKNCYQLYELYKSGRVHVLCII